MATAPTSSAPLVLLAESAHAEHHHAEMLTRAGFRVVRLTVHEVTPALVRDVKPAIIAMEFDGSQPSDGLDPRAATACGRTTACDTGSGDRVRAWPERTRHPTRGDGRRDVGPT